MADLAKAAELSKKGRRTAKKLLKRGGGRRLMYRITTRRSSRHALVGPADLWRMKRRFQFKFLTARGLQPEHRLLDIGCGTLRGGIPLIAYLNASHYVGVEARAEVLEEGRKELAESGLDDKRPQLIHTSDLSGVRLDAPVDFALAFSVLIHMYDDIADACLGLVARSLSETGEFYANVQLGKRPDGRWMEFPNVARPREFYERLAASYGLDVDEVGKLGMLGHRTGDRVHDNQTMLRFARPPG